MSYDIYKADGTTVTIPDGSLYQAFNDVFANAGKGLGVRIVGLGAADYPAAIGQNILQMQEHFCGATLPSDTTALQGQLWFNKLSPTTGQLYVRGTNTTSGGLANWKLVLTGNTTVTAGTYTAANITVDAQGRITAAASGGTVAGATTEIQYNNAGAFGASSLFTFVPGSRTLAISAVELRGSTETFGTFKIVGRNQNKLINPTYLPDTITLFAGDEISSGNGGGTLILRGASLVDGGDFEVTGGTVNNATGTGAETLDGGTIDIAAGSVTPSPAFPQDGPATGGAIYLSAGTAISAAIPGVGAITGGGMTLAAGNADNSVGSNAASSSGGNITMTAGSAQGTATQPSTNGGDMSFTAGSADGNLAAGGDITLTAGAVTGPGAVPGFIELTTTGLAVKFNGNGELKINNDAGTAGEVLSSNGVAAAPTWRSIVLDSDIATFVGGTVTVLTAFVTGVSVPIINIASLGTVTVPQAFTVNGVTVGVSFVVTSADPTDTSTFRWILLN